MPLRREGTLISCSIQHRLVLDVIVSAHYWEQCGLINSIVTCILCSLELPVVGAGQQEIGVCAARQPVGSGSGAYCAKGFEKV